MSYSTAFVTLYEFWLNPFEKPPTPEKRSITLYISITLSILQSKSFDLIDLSVTQIIYSPASVTLYVFLLDPFEKPPTPETTSITLYISITLSILQSKSFDVIDLTVTQIIYFP